jgi:hypothetical protein
MNKPQPAQEAIFHYKRDRWIRITVYTPDALSVVRAAQEFGKVYQLMTQSNLYDLYVADGYDVVEVLQYLKSQA